ncbi:MAG: PilZ domain-containing protein [Candidatus Omnitrophica bacterium]|nr:PilZ domain-containing protein [Candidatus Omnitrophota bacterium]MDD5552897.1 PilZ domain-containing protein [Candidatus Omnitrophota bacterium]
MQERRVFQRFNLEFPVEFYTMDDQKVEGKGKILNISAGGGGMVVTAKYLLPQTSLKIKLFIPDGNPPLEADAKVIWLKAMEPTLFLAGVQFDKVDFMGIARALRLHDSHNEKK